MEPTRMGQTKAVRFRFVHNIQAGISINHIKDRSALQPMIMAPISPVAIVQRKRLGSMLAQNICRISLPLPGHRVIDLHVFRMPDVQGANLHGRNHKYVLLLETNAKIQLVPSITGDALVKAAYSPEEFGGQSINGVK